MSEITATVKVEMTEREYTLVRVALLQRLDRLKGKSSYNEVRDMLMTGPFQLRHNNRSAI